MKWSLIFNDFNLNWIVALIEITTEKKFMVLLLYISNNDSKPFEQMEI